MDKINTSKEIWTIGHSTRSLREFLDLLHSFTIKTLVDIRHYPGSRRYPHFNQAELSTALATESIGYIHLVDLGGRRKPSPDSINTRWRLPAFRAYADYMQTDAFQRAAAELEIIAQAERSAIMCSEAVWWSCHRSMVADYLKARGWKVWHIMSAGKAIEHPFTKAAQIVDGKLRYDEPELW